MAAVVGNLWESRLAIAQGQQNLPSISICCKLQVNFVAICSVFVAICLLKKLFLQEWCTANCLQFAVFLRSFCGELPGFAFCSKKKSRCCKLQQIAAKPNRVVAICSPYCCNTVVAKTLQFAVHLPCNLQYNRNKIATILN